MRRSTLVPCAVALVALGAAIVAPGSTEAVPLAPAVVADAQQVFFIADSVGLSARDAMPVAFPPDWQVTVDGYPGVFVEGLETIVRRNIAERPGVFGDHAIIAAGYNYPYWDPARFDQSIDSMIAAFESAGVKQVYWVTLREVKPEYITASAWRSIQPYYWYFAEVNVHLRAALARHDNLTLIDWAAIADRPGLTYDAIHLNAFGGAEYSNNAARVVMESRNRIPTGTITPITVAGVNGVPAEAAAVALNLAVTSERVAGFVTAFPCGEDRPLAANMNYVADTTVSAAAIVPIGADGKVCIFNSGATHLIVDVMGSFRAGAFTRATGPPRQVDTRDIGPPLVAGQELRVQLPDGMQGAAAAVLNVTAIGGAVPGFVTATRCGDPYPVTSNVNFGAGTITPNLVVVAPDATGSVCIRPNQSAHLVVDLFGGLGGDSVSLPGASRSIDTRQVGPRPAAGAEVVAPTGAGGAVGVFVNVTATEPAAAAFLTVYPCGTARPPTANLNVAAGQTLGNVAVATPDADGKVCVFSNASTHVVVDVMGSVTAGFDGLLSPSRAFDSRD